jgi:uncharacterized repeat protein (TIGR03803 family)
MRRTHTGMALSLGILAAIPPAAAHAGTFSTLYSFSGLNALGAVPEGGLVYVNGALYGTTEAGGNSASTCNDGCGTVFKVDPGTGAETVIYAFKGSPDGGAPAAGVIYQGGYLYGTTELGGRNTCPDHFTCGTVFAVDLATGAESVLYNFTKNGRNGQQPVTSLLYQDGALYGTSVEGGKFGLGNVFSVNVQTRVGTALYSFQGGSGGEFPDAGLITNGNSLFGTTAGQSSSSAGTVFKLNAKTGAQTVLHGFDGTDGEFPAASLLNYDGLLYGTTRSGGSLGYGTIFSVDPKTGAATTLYSFGTTDSGIAPTAALINVGGMFYGTTSAGGVLRCTDDAGCGTIYRFDPKTGTETILYSFTGKTDEFNPAAGLIYQNGAFYGTTAVNGINGCGNHQGCGTVFKFVP